MIAGGNEIIKNNAPMTSLREIRLVVPSWLEAIPASNIEPIFKPMGELLNAVAKARGGGRGPISVIVDMPVWLDRDHEVLADVLRRAPFLRLRTPRHFDGRVMDDGKFAVLI